MRRSSNSDDISFSVWSQERALGKVHRVFLDGVEQKYVSTADEEAGFVIRAVLDADGHVQLDPRDRETFWEERVEGDVNILIEDAA